MERKKDYIRQFYPRCHFRSYHYRHIVAFEAFKQRSITFLYRLAYCLSGISFGHIFPIQAKIKK